MMETKIDRRQALKAVGGAGLAAAFGARALDLLGGDAQAATTCLLSPEVTEGPYWVENDLTRRNITEGKPGLPLQIRFTVLNAKTCKIIKNADVEIWHCDAVGDYSAVSGATTRFLRGHQKSNAQGKAEFLTIFPGWYRGRTPHIHMKVSVGGDAVHTGQVFFDETITRKVYAQTPYAGRGVYDTPHASDMIYADAGGSSAELKLTKRAAGLKGYLGTIAIGVVT
jgi:protocatechuate 3,4-dioxygenase beta subunit